MQGLVKQDKAYCESYSEYKICSLVQCMPVFKSKRFVCRVHSLLSQAGELLANQQTTISQQQLAMWAVHSVIKLWGQIYWFTLKFSFCLDVAANIS